jgi:hypothetical protein
MNFRHQMGKNSSVGSGRGESYLSGTGVVQMLVLLHLQRTYEKRNGDLTINYTQRAENCGAQCAWHLWVCTQSTRPVGVFPYLCEVRPIHLRVPRAGVAAGVQLQVLALDRRLQDVPESNTHTKQALPL